MWRFVLRENIRRFQDLLVVARTNEEQDTLRQLIREAESELTELEQASTPEVAKRDSWLNSVASRAVDQAIAETSAQFASLQIYDERREHLIILAQRNLRAAFLHHLANITPGDGSACGRCLADDAPAAVEDVNGDTAFAPHLEAATEAGFKAVQAVPVRDGSGKLIAVLSTYFATPRRFSDADAERISQIADSIGKNLEQHFSMKARG